nr:flavodoxin domain-containing protein [Jeotgalibacillus terrae]
MIVYASRTGNTEQLASLLYENCSEAGMEAELIRVEEFDLKWLASYAACIVVTYTWGSGDLPREILPLFEAFEQTELCGLVTGVAGSGDQCYPDYCGAVDRFRDMLYAHTRLAVTLKVELAPQRSDKEKCRKFAEKMIEKAKGAAILN